jgi:hypothetical protein
MEELSRTKGAITEFVNPKYKDASKTLFKSSTRLECMMQDYPRTLAPSAKVGFTVLDTWLAYAPVKNNAEDAMKIPEGNPKHSPTSGEIAIYKANCLILQKVLSSPCYFHSSLFYSYHAAFGVLGYCFGSLKVYGPVILHCPIFKHFLQNPQVFRTCCCTFWTAASLILEPDANKYHIDSFLCL